MRKARGENPGIIHYDSFGYFATPANVNDTENLEANRAEAERASGVPVTAPRPFNLDNIPPENSFDFSAKVEVTMEDLTSQMARMGAKQILAQELNIAHAQLGVKSYYTPEMLSALASKRLRAQQKAKKKAKRK